MSAQKTVVNEADPDGRWLYRVGGIAALVLGAAYVATIPLFVGVAASPAAGEARLKYLAQNATTWWTLLGLMVVTDFLYVPIALSLYLALKRINRDAMLVAAAFVGLFVVLDLAVLWPSYASLLTLSGKYVAATTDAERAALVAAAYYAEGVTGSRLEAVYAMVVLGVGILTASLVMLKGIFHKATAYLGVATGSAGIVSVLSPVSVGSVNVTIMLASGLTTIWVPLVGYRLFKLGRERV